MNYAYDNLNERKWYTPESYCGFSPIDDVVIAVQTRDSDALTRSNYQKIFEYLGAWEESWRKEHPGEYQEIIERMEDENDNTGELIYNFSAAHWAYGWVETLLMSKHAPDELQMEIDSICNAMSDYPVFDEEHWINLEWEEAQEYWGQMGIDERVELIQKHGGNIFAARHDYLNENADPTGSLFDQLRTP